MPLISVAALRRKIVEGASSERRDLLNRGIGGVRRERLLVEAPRRCIVAAQPVAIGDADLGAGELLLADEGVARSERSSAGFIVAASRGRRRNGPCR